jgi:phosphomannomutase
MSNILEFKNNIDLAEIKNRRLIAFDLDGTLAESKQILKSDMGILIGELLKKTDVVVISGGSFEQFKKQFLPSLPSYINQVAHGTGNGVVDHGVENEDTGHTLYMLPVSGSQRYEFSDQGWTMTDSVVFPFEQKAKVLEVLSNLEQKAVEFDLPKETFGPRVEERGTQITLSALGQSAPVNLKVAWDPDILKRKKIVEYLTPRLPDVDIHIGGSTSIDILPKGFDKSVGLQRLLSTKNMKREDMVFVGDAVFEGGNDYSPSIAGILTISIKNPNETAELIKAWIA